MSHTCVTDMIVISVHNNIIHFIVCDNVSDIASNGSVVVSKCEFELSHSRLRRCYCNNLNQFRFIQLNHRGGFCDCWEVTNLTVTLTNGWTRKLR